jgi:hypothetical protein
MIAVQHLESRANGVLVDHNRVLPLKISSIGPDDQLP